MKKTSLLLFVYFFAVTAISMAQSPADALIKRIIGANARYFKTEIAQSLNGKDFFEISAAGGTITIKGNNGVSIAAGFNWYLKYYCHCQFSWNGNNLTLPHPLPMPGNKIRIESIAEFSYYLNYCTFNYSASFWDWPRWEKEIDWMAMNGINLPLAIVGTEAVWRNTLKKFNFTQKEIDQFIPGPAYFAWWLMGNLEGAGGPLSSSWYNERIELQKKILKRMRELGMEPVLPAFYGMVPTKLKAKYPDADIRDQGKWAGGYTRPSFLVSTDPLFKKMAEVFYAEQKKLFGSAKYFSGDPFHEGGQTKGIDITAAGKEIIKTLQSAVENPVLVLQGWGGNPRYDLIKGIDKKNILILDLAADYNPQWSKRDNWHGYNWIWSIIDNFGGKPGIFGALDSVAVNPITIIESGKGGSIKGIGAMMEGIENNTVTYDLLFETRWRNKPVDLNKWIKEYARRRYGFESANTDSAWSLFLSTAYRNGLNSDGSGESILCARPSLKIERTSTWGTSKLGYDTKKFAEGWKYLVEASFANKGSDAFNYDLTDFTRQVLSNLFADEYENAVKAFNGKDIPRFESAAKMMIEIIDDLEKLLSTRSEFLAGRWINKARLLGSSESEKDLFEKNARALLTTWSWYNSDLRDYAHREFAGMLKDYYKPRWIAFLNNLREKMNGNNPPEADYYSIEKKWVDMKNRYSFKPEGNTKDEVKNVFTKYSNILFK